VTSTSSPAAKIVVQPELADVAHAREVLELAGERLGQLLALAGADLDGGVAVALGRPDARHGVG
jgi:hypothetical protein